MGGMTFAQWLPTYLLVILGFVVWLLFKRSKHDINVTFSKHPIIISEQVSKQLPDGSTFEVRSISVQAPTIEHSKVYYDLIKKEKEGIITNEENKTK